MNKSLILFPIIYELLDALLYIYIPILSYFFFSTEVDFYTIESIQISTILKFFFIASYFLAFMCICRAFKFNKKVDFTNQHINISLLRIILILVALFYISSFELIANFENIRAVLFNREGFGYIYVLYWNILFLYILLRFYSRDRVGILEILILVVLLYLTGSKKAFILASLIFLMKNILNKNNVYFLIIICIFVLFISFYIFSGVDVDDLTRYMIAYFDHQVRGGQFLMILSKTEFDTVLLFDQYWSYLPRLLFPDKPYIYGDLYLIDLISPNSLKTGYAPAIPYWGYSYAIGGICLSIILEILYAITTAYLVFKIHFSKNIIFPIFLMQFTFGIFIYPSRAHLFLVFIPLLILLLKKRSLTYA